MKHLIINSLFFSLVFSSFFVCAQKDYIVNNAGDTIRGELKSQAYGLTPKFKALGNSNFEVIKPEKTSFYYRSIDSTMFISKKMPYIQKPVFFQRLCNGKIQLLEIIFYANYNGGIPMALTDWYAVKGNGELMEIKDSKLKISGKGEKVKQNNFYTLIGDNKNILDAFIAEGKYSFELIKAYVMKYNLNH